MIVGVVMLCFVVRVFLNESKIVLCGRGYIYLGY